MIKKQAAVARETKSPVVEPGNTSSKANGRKKSSESLPASLSSITLRQVPAVNRAVAILFYLSASSNTLGVSKIARDLEILPSTCLHILRELVVGGLATFNASDKTYGIGLGVLTLARQLSNKDMFAKAAQMQIDAIARKFNVKATASRPDELGHMVVVACTTSEEDSQVHVPVGLRVPLLASAGGRCFAAFNAMPEARLLQLFNKVRWQNGLRYEDWKAQVASAKSTGLGIDEGAYRKGITAIVVPVFSSDGSANRFIGANAVSEQLGPTQRKELASALKSAARELSRVLMDGAPITGRQ